jgi:hypothetical protein
MFRIQMQRAALALAGAVLVASSLMSSIAAAAPISSADPEGVQIIKGPKVMAVADGEVKYVIASFHGDHVNYIFRVKNHGPDAVIIKLHMYESHWVDHPGGIVNTSAAHSTLTLQPGQEIDDGIPSVCAGNNCQGANAYIDVVGADSNTGNNWAAYWMD